MATKQAGSALKTNVTGYEDLPRWKIALAIGIPVAGVAAGVWLYKRRSKRTKKNDGKQTKSDKDKQTGVAEVEQTPLEKATGAKNKGNKYFKGGKYDLAIKCYSEAIDVCPSDHDQELSTFYQNRAAAYEQLKNYAKVIEDCSKALEFNSKYTKALNRRAKACEITKDYTTCLEDITAVCILEGFSNQGSLVMADRVLKELGRTRAVEAYKNRKPLIPSPQFVKTYFSAFANDPIMDGVTQKKEKSNDLDSPTEEGDAKEKEQIESSEKEVKASPYEQAREAVINKDFKDIVSLCTDELNLENSSHTAEALLLRATFFILQGEGNKAIEDLDRLLDMQNVDKRIQSNALIKRGSLKMNNSDQTDSLDDFATAVRVDPENSDIYHHRGQVNLLLDRVDDAVKDFEKSITLSPNFGIAFVQKCYTEYRLSFANRSPMQLQTALKHFEEALERFPNCAEGFALYGQALCDQQQFERAEENFLKALELEPDNGTVYVHRGLVQLQWKQDGDAAAKLMEKAIEVDSRCEFAYETLGTIEVQRGNLEKAIELFNKAISLTKTELEMAHLHSLLEAAIAQSKVAKRFGVQIPMGPPM